MFQGFSQATGDFLWGLSMNNDRAWFQAHRQEYEDALNRPFRALAADTVERMNQRFPDQEFRVHLSRIYRDARRLFGRGPFKDHLWFSLYSGDRHNSGPMFWFEVSGTGWSCGAGIWEEAADIAEHWRGRIDAQPERFAQIVKDLDAHGPYVLYGELYKRPKADRGELNPWYNRKHLSAGYERGFGGVMCTPELTDALMEAYAALMPLYLFLMDAYNDTLVERAGR